MIKLMVLIGEINYDHLLSELLAKAKEHPEMLGGMKLPPFSDKMLRLVPQGKKNEMLASMANERKGQVIPRLEAMLSAVTGPVTIRDFSIACGSGPDKVSVMLEIGSFDCDQYVDRVLPSYYEPAYAARILGEDAPGISALADIQTFIHSQSDPKKKEYYVARSLSVGKAALISRLEQAAASKGVTMKINNIRVMVK
jgi:hypothetical protein